MSETGCEQAGSEEKRGWFGRLKAGLSRSAGQLGSSIGALFTKRRLDQDALDELEETLIQADLGITTAGKIVAAIAKRSEEHTSELQSLMRSSYAVFCLKQHIRHSQGT